MLTKLEISGTIQLRTGMHIGGPAPFSAIGTADSPVLRDPESNLPMIPGSSLKGKLRYLLAKSHNQKSVVKSHNEDDDVILRLFGSSRRSKIQFSRLVFTDMILTNGEDLKTVGIMSPTEVKFENSIHRLTAVSNPRQIERVIRGAEFPMTIIYNVEVPGECEEDMALLCEGLKLLTYDYLGGHGSRGYGRVELKELKLSVVVGKLDECVLERCRALLKDVER